MLNKYVVKIFDCRLKCTHLALKRVMVTFLICMNMFPPSIVFAQTDNLLTCEDLKDKFARDGKEETLTEIESWGTRCSKEDIDLILNPDSASQSKITPDQSGSTSNATLLKSRLFPPKVNATAENGQAVITWSPVNGAISYSIYWSTSPMSGMTKSNRRKITGATSPYIHTKLKNGTTYYYAVIAENIHGTSLESNEVTVFSGGNNKINNTNFQIASSSLNCEEIKEYYDARGKEYVLRRIRIGGTICNQATIDSIFKETSKGPIFKKWWFWTGVVLGGLVAGGALLAGGGGGGEGGGSGGTVDISW